LFFVQYRRPKDLDTATESIGELETRFVLEDKPTNFKDMLGKKKNRIFRNDDVSIYVYQSYEFPEIMYVYSGSVNDKQLNDKFFLHVYIRDHSFLEKEKPLGFLNLDFNPVDSPPEVIISGSNTYTVFKKRLNHWHYIDDNIPLDNIKFINTGRFKKGAGRSFNAENLAVNTIPPNTIRSTIFKNMTLTVSKKSFEKIKAKRDEALKSTVLITSDDDFVKATVSTSDKANLDAKIRLKGDWTDHLVDKRKWSYRVVMDGDETLFGMRKFSVQDPRSRNLAWEWLFNKVVKDEDLIGLRYGFTNVSVQVKNTANPINMGIMAVEESFDKILIENNKRREGIILGFDEGATWKERKVSRELQTTWSSKLGSMENVNIKVYNTNKVLSDPKLAKQLDIAKNLIEGLRRDELKISDVCDLDKVTTYVALSNLFGGVHGLVGHNIRMYYNPITNKLEPVSFDSNSGKKLIEIGHYPFARGDYYYNKLLTQKLKYVSSTDFINGMFEKHDEELASVIDYLRQDFTFVFDREVIEHNANFIRKTIAPADVVSSSILKVDDHTIKMSILNTSEFTVELGKLTHKDGKLLSTDSDIKVLQPNERLSVTYTLDPSFANAFVSKKSKKGGFSYPKDVAKLRLVNRILGIDKEHIAEIAAFGIDEADKVAKIESYRTSFKDNFEANTFVSVNDKKKEITFLTGKYSISQPLIIPSDYVIKVQPGFELDLKNNAYLFSNSTIDAIGTKEQPIQFYSSDSSGSGIFINKTKRESELRYCTFSNLSNPVTDIWELSGAVNFHEADVTIANCVFENNRCEDGLNIIRSTFRMNDTEFRNTKSDAFDGDFVVGTITDTAFTNAGNDGIDVSGSRLILDNITINNPSDKAISAGEASTIEGGNIYIIGGEIGIVSKDLSSVNLNGVSIKDTQLAFSAFQKKTEYGTGIIDVVNLVLANNQTDFLIERGSRMTVDGDATETVSNKVIDQMYGNEYGKSSN